MDEEKKAANPIKDVGEFKAALSQFLRDIGQAAERDRLAAFNAGLDTAVKAVGDISNGAPAWIRHRGAIRDAILKRRLRPST